MAWLLKIFNIKWKIILLVVSGDVRKGLRFLFSLTIQIAICLQKDRSSGYFSCKNVGLPVVRSQNVEAL